MTEANSERQPLLLEKIVPAYIHYNEKCRTQIFSLHSLAGRDPEESGRESRK